MAETTNCELCVLCQEKTNEELVCPLDNPVGVRRAEAYKDIISLVNQFRDVDAAPHPNLELPDEGSMQANRASWHKTCRQLYKGSALDRAKTRSSKGLPPLRKRPRRSSTETNRNLCLFCNEETSKDDHSFQKVSLTKNIHDKAVSLGEDRIVAWLAEGDLVAIEANYHRYCYTKFNRRHYEMLISTKQGQVTQDTEITVENELLQFVSEEIAGGRRIFALQDLTDMMTERLGQHEMYMDSNDVPLAAPIKKNNLLLFHEEKTRKKTALQKKVQHFKQHTELYGQAFIMVDSRGGNLEEFFRHESSSSPDALASDGSINSCTKSDLLACIMEASASTGLSADEELVAPDDYGVIVIDGGALIHSLPGTTVQGKTFDEYFTKVFCPRIQHELKRAARVDIVWDQYRTMSIKATTREKRGTGTRQRVSGSAKVPGNWQNFLANAENKKELFSFLSTSIVQTPFQDGKQVYITSGDQVLNAGNGPPMGRCNHEEADTRVLVHLLHALQYSSLGMVYTGDTDVVVILLCNFHHIKAVNPESDIWISFKAGKTVKMISLNNIASSLGVTTCKALALFHAFTGSDSTSAFKFKGKRYCFKRKDEVPPLLSEFATIASTPFLTSPELREVD
uniref:uncharacterized protein n=1 Tax=Myxine glutinosa TaxID=7769 RepID=UPI00358DF69B